VYPWIPSNPQERPSAIEALFKLTDAGPASVPDDQAFAIREFVERLVNASRM